MVVAAHPVAQRKTPGQRQSATDDGIAAVKIGFRIEQVHRPAAPAGTALGLAIHLGQNLVHRHAAHQCVTVFAVGRHDLVVRAQHRNDARRNRLFPVIEMKKPADLFLRVDLGAFVLETPDADHVPEQRQHMRPVELWLVDHSHVSSVSNVEMSPSGSPSSRAFKQPPHDLAGSCLGQRVAEKDFARGHGGAKLLSGVAANVTLQILRPLETGIKRDIGLYDFARGLVGHADHTSLGNGCVFDQRAFHFEWADQVAGGLDQVVRAAHEPEIAVVVPHREIARQIPAIDKAFVIAGLFMKIGAHHRWPAGPKRQFADLLGAQFRSAPVLFARRSRP